MSIGQDKTGLDAEICILAVVLSDLALLPLARPRAGLTGSWWNFFRAVTAFGLGCLMMLAGMLYALITAGINHDTDAAVWWILGGALCGSLLLAMERAARP